MIRRPPGSTRTDTLFPYTTLFRSLVIEGASRDLWCLSTQPDYSENLLRQYFARRDNMDAAAVELARRVDGSTITGACTAGYTQMHVPARPARPAPLSARPAPPQPPPAKQTDDRPQPDRSEEHTSELQ